MTRVEFHLDGKELDFRAEGHSGVQIVCSKVSILSQTLVDAVSEYMAGVDNDMNRVKEYQEAAGSMRLSLDISGLREEQKDHLILIYATIQKGFEVVMQQFPENVEVKTV